MATNYPYSLDNWEEKIASEPVMAGHLNNLQDAIYQLQRKVGADATSLDTTLDFKINNFICASNHMFFYENSAPTGWTATLIPGDRVLAVGNANAGSYTGVATLAGTWSIQSDIISDTHNHLWHYFVSNTPYYYTRVGGLENIYNYSMLNIGKHTYGYSSYYYSKNTSDYFDIKVRKFGTHGYVDTDNHTHTFTTGWRPNTAVGILAYYTGP